MTRTLYMTLGLPGSGKSTWARKMARDNANVKRVNKDELRDMVDDGLWNKRAEKEIVKAQDRLVHMWLDMGRSVIVDNTNFGWEEHFRKIANQYQVAFEVVDFTAVSLETCVKRDLARPRSVGREVIQRMYNQYLAPAPEVYEFTPGLPTAIIVDIDGTLAHMVPGPDGTTRSPYDYTRVQEDQVDEVVAGLVRSQYSSGRTVLVVSGRDDECRDVTSTWLHRHAIPFHEIHMRKTGDGRKDSIVKREIFDTHIRDRFNVLFVLDDRNQVVDEWRRMGLKCLQVQPGAF